MKLSKLVSDKESLRQKSTKEICEQVNDLLAKLTADIANIGIDTTDARQHMDKYRQEILSLFEKFESEKDHVYQDLLETINQAGKSYYQRSEEIYALSRSHDSARYVNDRYLFDSYIKHEDVHNTFKQRIETYALWTQPGLFIRPEKGDFVEPMISNDPLYILDEDKEMLLMVKNKWTPEYQSRIRYGIVSDDKSPHTTTPVGQIGLIVAYHFFNYKPLDVIKGYLKECYDLLKPGGVLVFTYNNCDLPDAVVQVENAYQSYTPKSTLLLIIEGLGYELLHAYDFRSNVSWLEIKKPGTLTSLRGGQALAQIKDSRLDN